MLGCDAERLQQAMLLRSMEVGASRLCGLRALYCVGSSVHTCTRPMSSAAPIATKIAYL